ncbi:hypothetical protein [Nigerium massiliense]|uniref:hypothetical protein n=1 Tax=Nigerium massiliense TaxID=1522317 RepID=UPI00058F7F86|nr:hypothetical protein [Nigerium massiliense]
MAETTATDPRTGDPVSRPENPRATDAAARRVFGVLSGLTALGIMLQGLWAGMFLAEDPRPEYWVQVHDTGAKAVIALAVITTVWALWKLRAQRGLWIGALLLTVLLAGVGHLGGLITDDGADQLAAVHVPLAMVVMALSVWLPMHARRGRA